MTSAYNNSNSRAANQHVPGPRSKAGISLLSARTSKFSPKIFCALLPLLLISGCETIDLKRVAYDFLRQEDCRRNDVDVYEFCSRTFVFEYDEYEQLRREYIRSEEAKTRRDQATRELYHNLYNDGV